MPNRMAWTSTHSFACLYLAGAVVSLVSWSFIGLVSLWQWYLAALVALLFAIATFAARRPTPTLSTGLFLASTGFLLFANSIDTHQMAKMGACSVAPFSAFKLVAIAVAVIVPAPVWAGFLGITICLAVPVLQVQLSAPVFRAGFSALEPWYTVLYTMIAFFVLRHRLHSIKMERTLTKVTADKRSLDNLAKIFLTMRDLTNTPLQAIELTSALLGAKQMSAEEGAEHLRSSLVKLRELSRMMSYYEADVDWSTTAASFDGNGDLIKKLDDLKQGATLVQAPF